MLKLSEILDELEKNEIGKKFSTDKASLHSYIQKVYEPLVGAFQDPRLIVEIGVLHGASLAMWKTVFPSARVIGVDLALNENLHPEFFRMLLKGEIELVIGDAYSQEVLDSLPNDIDLFIDDGSHNLSDQVKILKQRSKLSTHGVLIIEDISCGWVSVKKLIANLNGERTKNVVVLPLHLRSGRYDDCILIWTQDSTVIDLFRNQIGFLGRLWLLSPFFAIIVSPVGQFWRLQKKLKKLKSGKNFLNPFRGG